jgi:hypothetical protein
MCHILEFQTCFSIGNDMSQVHDSVNSVVGGGISSLSWTDENGRRRGSTEL